MATNPLPPLPGLPSFLSDVQNQQDYLNAMLAALPPGLDQSEGSFVQDVLAPLAIQLAQAGFNGSQLLARTFAQYTFGSYLDLRANEHGLYRLPATKASGVVTFTGAPGTFIPGGTVVATGSSAGQPSVGFVTLPAATVLGGGSVDVEVQAQVGAAASNVSAGTILFLGPTIPGITGVTNAAPTTGGRDSETDAAFLTRYLLFVRNPAAGGNVADYVNWALAVNGVGAVAVDPLWNGPGTVAVYIVDTNKALPSQALVDAVQHYIAPPRDVTAQATLWTPGGFGVAIDLGTLSMKMVYNAGGDGTLIAADMEDNLPQAGQWTVRLTAKVDAATGTHEVLSVGVYNVTAGGWAQTTADGGTNSLASLAGNQFTTAFAPVLTLFFWWNGTDELDLRLVRNNTVPVVDTTTQVFVKQAEYISTFSSGDGAGLAPIGAAVTVAAPGVLTITISATLTIDPNSSVMVVQAAVTAAIDAYLLTEVFAVDRTIRYTQIALAILDVPGITDYAALLVNGGTTNLLVAPDTIPQPGVYTWS